MPAPLTVASKINDRYDIMLTPDRREFHLERPGWEKERLDHCVEHIKEGMVVYDLGAESGDFTALYHLWVGPEGTVVPVEPQPAYWPQIRCHWEHNNLPPIRGYFGGFASRQTNLIPPIDDGHLDKMERQPSGWPQCSIGEIIPDFGFRHLAQQTDHTPEVRIDALVGLLNIKPDVIVMDIEGAEYNALRGMPATLVELHPLLYVSIHQPTMADWYDATLDQLLTYMAQQGYTGEKLGEGSEEYWVFQ